MRGVDLIGREFLKLKVVSYQGKDKYSHNLWLCICSCGNSGIWNTSDLLSGNTTSCGCHRKENTSKIGKSNKTHGMSLIPGYKSWGHIVDRCTNPEHENYHNYGGRGILISQEWLKSPEKMLDHLGPKPSALHSVDRIDNDGNYEPGNVRWATPKEQANNTRKNINIEYFGTSYVLSDLAKKLGICRNTLKNKLDSGKWSVEDSVYEACKVSGTGPRNKK